MKQLIAFITLFMLLVGSSSGRAELIIYKGTDESINTGENKGAPLTSKQLLIVDHTTGHYARIGYYTLDGRKSMTSFQHTNTHIVQVVSANGKSYSAIAFILPAPVARQFPGRESIAYKGLDAKLKVSATSTVTFPKTLTMHDSGVFYHSSGATNLLEVSRSLTFSPEQTVASNTVGDTLRTALARLINEVKAMGYQVAN